jgi:hypothetical protein
MELISAVRALSRQLPLVVKFRLLYIHFFTFAAITLKPVARAPPRSKPIEAEA